MIIKYRTNGLKSVETASKTETDQEKTTNAAIRRRLVTISWYLKGNFIAMYRSMLRCTKCCINAGTEKRTFASLMNRRTQTEWFSAPSERVNLFGREQGYSEHACNQVSSC